MPDADHISALRPRLTVSDPDFFEAAPFRSAATVVGGREQMFGTK
jgi:hypothetical protein